jgi:hypothetical protein
MYTYAYIIGDLILAPLFFLLFFKRKDLKSEMLINGVIGGIVAFATGSYFLSYYWSPITLLNIKYCIEDFLFGFFLCSESAVIFNYVFKKYYEPHSLQKIFKDHTARVILTIISVPMLFIMLEHITFLNPIYNSMLSFLIPLSFFFILNKSLIKVALFTGIFVFVYTLLFYFVFEILFPGIIGAWWNTKELTGLTLYGLPAEELIWFAIVGMYCSSTFKFSFDVKFLNISE